MLLNQEQHQTQPNQITSENEIFSQIISTYELIEPESNLYIPPNVEEEILTEQFIQRLGLTQEEKDQDIAICRKFEGDQDGK